MSIQDEINSRLRAIRQDERRSKDSDAANAARHVVWSDYIEHMVQLNPHGAAVSRMGEAG